MLTKLGLAKCTNLSIFDGEKEQLKNNIGEKHLLKRAPVQTNLEKITKEIKQMPNKVVSTIPNNTVLCKVTNALSPSEIWVQDVVDSNSLFEQFQTTLTEKYNQLKLVPNAKQWDKKDYCVMKKPRQRHYYRAKVIEKLSNGKFKLICLDNGLYETCEEQCLYELIDEFNNKPAYKAKKCSLVGVSATGTNNGKWSSLAEVFTNETLTDNYVHVLFHSTQKLNETYQVCIYVDARQKEVFKQEYLPMSGNSEFIRFADILNNKGLALLTEKSQRLDTLLANRMTHKTALLLSAHDTHCSYTYPDLPKKSTKIIKIISMGSTSHW